MYLIGQKVITPDGVQGYVDEVTQFGEVRVKILSDTIDAHTPPCDRVVSEYYDKCGEGLTLCAIQRPLLEDFTRFGVIHRLESLNSGIIECQFIVNGIPETAIWMSNERVSQIGGEVPFEDAHWVKGEHTDAILDFFDLEIRADGICEPKSLEHEDIAHQCIVQAILPCGNLREWAASVDGEGRILDIEVECENAQRGYRDITSISELKALGVQRAQLVSTYSIKGFADIHADIH